MADNFPVEKNIGQRGKKYHIFPPRPLHKFFHYLVVYYLIEKNIGQGGENVIFFPLAQIFPSFGSQLLSKKNIGQGGENIISSPLDNRKKGEKDKAKSIYKKKGQLGKNIDKGEKI